MVWQQSEEIVLLLLLSLSFVYSICKYNYRQKYNKKYNIYNVDLSMNSSNKKS